MHARKADRSGDDRVPRRGWAATAGLLLIALGAWGALVPFIGPYFDFAFTPDDAWRWTAPRGWLSVLPGAVTAVAGLALMGSATRGGAAVAAWAAVAGGGWFVIGPVLAAPLRIGDPGAPTGDTAAMRALEQSAYHELLGVVIVFLAAVTLGRHGAARTRITEEPAPRAGDPHRRRVYRAEPGVVVDDRADSRGRGDARTADGPARGPLSTEQAQERMRQADDVQNR